jgi:hypothetical protein
VIGGGATLESAIGPVLSGARRVARKILIGCEGRRRKGLEVEAREVAFLFPVGEACWCLGCSVEVVGFAISIGSGSDSCDRILTSRA